MRNFLALLTVGFLAACGQAQTQSEHALVGDDQEMRQRLAAQDVEAILQGMAHARASTQEVARSTR